MTKITDIPAIRFKGFSDTWEQRKLGEIGSVSMCRRIFKEQTSENGEIPFYKIGTFGGEADAFISRELFEEYKAKYQYPKKGDILISASGSIGRTVVFTGKNEYFQDSNIVWLNHDKHLDNSFLKCFYSIVKWAGIEGSTIKRLYNDNILNTAITLPSVEEQQKIGAYFENLDNLITLHQCKCQIDGCRFQSPLAITWEQRKLEAVLSLLKDGTHGTHQDAEEGPYLLRAKNIKNGQIIIDDSSDRKISEDEFNQIHTKFTLENGDILLTIVGSIGESAILESAGKFTFQRSVAFLRPSEEMTSRFLKTEIESVQFQKELNDRKSQSAQPGVYLGDLSKIPIYITSKEEQKKIGKYFSHLDNLITLHQRKPVVVNSSSTMNALPNQHLYFQVLE